MSLSREFSGSGAMLARLVDLGARAGLTATQTLLHVLDGAPLDRPKVDPAVLLADRDRDQQAAAALGLAVPRDPPPDTIPEGAFPTDPAELLRIGLDLGDDDAAIAFALQAPLKRERVLTLYGCTGLRPGRIAVLAGSTRMSTSYFLNEARKAGDPRVVEGDRTRGGPPQMAPRAERKPASTDLPGDDDTDRGCFEFPEAGPGFDQDRLDELNAEAFARELGIENWRAPDEAPMAVDGDGVEPATAPLSELIDIPPVGFNGEVGRADPGPDVSPERAPERPRSQVRILPGSSVASEGAPVAQPGRAGQNGDAGSNPAAQAPPALSSVVRAPSHSPEGAPACAERDVEPAHPDEDIAAFPAPQDASTAPEMGTVRQDQPTLDAPAEPDTADRPAGPGLDSETEDAPGTSVKERILGLYGKTTLRVAAIAEQLGKSQNQVSGCIATARKAGDPRVIDGDTARRAVTTMAEIANSVRAPIASPPSPPEPSPPAVAPPILSISGSRIEGPTGGLNGFPLVNRILAALADGMERHCDDVASVAEARSGAAVKAVLGQWARDLTTIGVTVAIGNHGGVLLRKAAA